MRVKKYYLYLTDTEWRVMLLALNEMRSKLIAQGRYTDAVDEIIMRIMFSAKTPFCVRCASSDMRTISWSGISLLLNKQ